VLAQTESGPEMLQTGVGLTLILKLLVGPVQPLFVGTMLMMELSA
jgi:hypothetical protein